MFRSIFCCFAAPKLSNENNMEGKVANETKLESKVENPKTIMKSPRLESEIAKLLKLLMTMADHVKVKKLVKTAIPILEKFSKTYEYTAEVSAILDSIHSFELKHNITWDDIQYKTVIVQAICSIPSIMPTSKLHEITAIEHESSIDDSLGGMKLEAAIDNQLFLKEFGGRKYRVLVWDMTQKKIKKELEMDFCFDSLTPITKELVRINFHSTKDWIQYMNIETQENSGRVCNPDIDSEPVLINNDEFLMLENWGSSLSVNSAKPKSLHGVRLEPSHPSTLRLQTDSRIHSFALLQDRLLMSEKNGRVRVYRYADHEAKELKDSPLATLESKEPAKLFKVNNTTVAMQQGRELSVWKYSAGQIVKQGSKTIPAEIKDVEFIPGYDEETFIMCDKYAKKEFLIWNADTLCHDTLIFPFQVEKLICLNQGRFVIDINKGDPHCLFLGSSIFSFEIRPYSKVLKKEITHTTRLDLKL